MSSESHDATPSHEGSPWLVLTQCTRPRLRLVCFPYAGAGTLLYRRWTRGLPQDVQLILVQLPGRETRYAESATCSVPTIVEAICHALQPYASDSLVLFGHSMGAVLAFETARVLCRAGRSPQHVVLSGRGPDASAPASLSRLDDEELMSELARLGAFPQAALANRELMRHMLPVFRADTCLLESYRPSDTAPLPVTASVFGGLADPTVPREALLAWRRWFRGPVDVRFFPGGHFFLHSVELAVLEVLSSTLCAAS